MKAPECLRMLHLSAVLLILVVSASSAQRGGQDGNRRTFDKRPDKLLVVVVGGFRWDFLSKFRGQRAFRGFDEFQRRGVRADFLTSVFPAEDFPAWRTVATGRYPGSHGIIANQFYDPSYAEHENVDVFDRRNRRPASVRYFNYEDERTTGEIRWWEKAKPIWATAKEQGINFTTLLWSRCDVKWFGTKTIKPAECEPFFYRDNSKTLPIMLETALGHFQQGKADAALIYEGSLQEEAEQFGPLSRQVGIKLRALDRDVQTFLRRLREVSMDQSVNVVIMSDHGVTYRTDPPPAPPNNDPFRQQPRQQQPAIRAIPLAKLLRRVSSRVRRVVGSGAHASVWPKDERFTQDIVYELKRNRMAGEDSYEVFAKEEIPERLHWVNDFNTPPILILAHNGTVLLRAKSNLQRPLSMSRSSNGRGTHSAHESAMGILDQTRRGISGYDPEEEDMRGVFMAMGPGFKDGGDTYDAIELVDVYGMFCHLLGIEPEVNDGVWERVKKMLRNDAIKAHAHKIAMTALAFVVVMRNR